MANWEVTKTKRYNKPIEEHHANLKGGSYRIEVPEGSRMGVLYRWDDLRGYERIASGEIASLKSQAERMTAKQSRGVAAIERLANMSRPGAKDVMAVEDRFYFGKGRKERFAERSAMGESDLRELLRQSYLASGDKSDRAKINTNFLNAVMSRPAYFSPDGIAGGRSTHELVQIIRKRLTYK